MKESKKVLTKKDITKLGLMSSFLQASFNYERMQAGGFTVAQLPFLKKIYKNDKKAISDAMSDNLEFINTHPNLVGFLMGLLISLEENNEDRSIIKGLKVALFGPLAGIGDAIFWFTLLPIVAGISASFAMEGSVLGPIIFFTVYLIVFILRIAWTHLGYNLGVKAIDKIKHNSKVIGKAATVLGVTVIGGLIASYVKINVLTNIVVNESKTVSLQTDFFDKIFPNILPLGYTLLMYFLIKNKKISPVVLIFSTFIMSILLSFVGIL
ncbi:PTS galactosamine transporter subunit IID [Clostridium tertium]|uniref:PTS galactosamine transporter subunit IID n=1 Tax=Clostridium tertium TaxID=1559 RepID=A0A9X3XJP8_9CLOT|nr:MULTISPECIES: PTS galactosamine transporter subunit IID [Clostridium]MBP1868886.1 PTS system galactosamine-specific IID component [Clostridium tertium]MBS5305927.1 PTS N-acetylgalactosamine transporter subunit IID [Clostridium sp.]MBU6134158.1 PTS N-acetylgalactosamine transporter subunit IID [Clostridium tertium]MDB1920964.1 PTS galactosamine transporter subunit IID [Clostridium tertium]MDB1925495.1 PTS galactosamine transporter subunit IID [Clostridium tertium]